VAQYSGLGLGERPGVRRIEQHVGRLDPVDPPEPGDQMRALDRDAVQLEVGEAGVSLGAGVPGGEARQEMGRGCRLHAAQDACARSGQGILPAGSAIEQQRHARVVREVAGVLGQVGEQQQRA
jgi:hypothetical protein